ncbi:hypothetical protein BDZ89DRAFT_1151734, partial [Hymenopellis radicata]
MSRPLHKKSRPNADTVTSNLMAHAAQRNLDHANALRDASNRQSNTPQTPSTPSPSFLLPRPMDPPALNTPNPFVSTPTPYVASSMVSSASRLKATGERLLKKVKLSDEDQAVFRDFCETTDPQEQSAMLMIHMLKVQSLLRTVQEDKAETWKPSKTLAKMIRMHCKALLLLPNLRFFSGTLEATIIAAMRKSAVKGLPAEGDN